MVLVMNSIDFFEESTKIVYMQSVRYVRLTHPSFGFSFGLNSLQKKKTFSVQLM